MNVGRTAVAAVLVALALPALAGATSGLTATGIRIGDHPAYVRVVVDFTGGGALEASEVQALGLTRISAGVRVSQEKVTTRATRRTAHGVTVRVRQGAWQLRVQISFKAWRIKYLSYAIVTGKRLAIDLWKSVPPSRAAEIRKAAGGCLSLRSWRVGPGVVTVTGRERNLFENTFQVLLRGGDGRVIGRHLATYGPGTWSARVRYAATRRQPATLEAVASSPKDGALSCIAQVRVSLPAS